MAIVENSPVPKFPDGGFDYAWKWFDFHAKQRQSNIQFSISLLTAALAATGYLSAQSSPILSLLVSLVGVLACIVFYGLDCRNAFLVKLAERHLLRFELSLDSENTEFSILRSADEKDRFMIKYSWGARLLYASFACFFFLSSLVSLYQIKLLLDNP